MTSRKRLQGTFRHQETDRVPILESPWASTIARWRQEGMGLGDFRQVAELVKQASARPPDRGSP